jgi:NCS2 family nucleobase:cation symporter-2
MSTFAQNNGVIALTRCANRKAGYCCCLFLIVMGVFSKFAAALVAIPSPVLGGMTTFLFSAVAVSGIRIISTVPFTRRNRFILTAAMSVGFGATLVPKWFSYVFTYSGSNTGLQGFFNAIILVMETGFAVTAFLALILNLLIPEEIADEVVDNTANVNEEGHDQEEWERIRRPSVIRAARKSAELEAARQASVSVSEHHDVEKMGTINESQAERL